MNVRRWAHALFTEPTPLTAFCSLNIPVLYMVGKRSTPSVKGVARLLTAALRELKSWSSRILAIWVQLPHPDLVNDVIARFLERV